MFREIAARYPGLVNRKNLTRAGLAVAVAVAGGGVYLATRNGRGELEADPQLTREDAPGEDVGGGDTGGIELPGEVPDGVLPTQLPSGTGDGCWTFSGNAWYGDGEVGEWSGFTCVDGVWEGEIVYPDGRKEKVAVSPPANPSP